MQFSTFSIAVCGLFCTAAALAQTPAAKTDPDTTRCERAVHQYVQAMRYVRETAGNEASNKFLARYVSEKEVEKMSAEAGPCVAAKTLRDKGLL